MRFTLAFVVTLAASTGVANAACTAYQHHNYEGQGEVIKGGENVKFLPENSAILSGKFGSNERYVPSLEGHVSGVKLENGCTAVLFGVGEGAPGHAPLKQSTPILPDGLHDKVAAISCVCN